MTASTSSYTPQWTELAAEDRIDEYDEWQPRDSKRWFQAWPEDHGKTVAQVQAEAANLGEPNAYRWRGLR